MDFAPTSCSSTAVVSKPTTRRTIPWPDASSVQQYFSLPSSLIYYIAKNPSTPTAYNKLIQSGKYFFEKNPILVVARVFDNCGELRICSSKTCTGWGPCCLKIDINKISSKFWFIQHLCLEVIEQTNFTSLLCPKIYRSDINVIRMRDKHVLFDDFKFLASSVTVVNIDNVEITDNDGKAVALEDIIAAVPKIKSFDYTFCKNHSVTTLSTMKTIAKLMDPEQLELFSLDCIPADALDVDDLSAFVTQYQNALFFLSFNDDIILEEYKVQLDALVDTIIATEDFYCMILYAGQDREKRRIIEKRFFPYE